MALKVIVLPATGTELPGANVTVNSDWATSAAGTDGSRLEMRNTLLSDHGCKRLIRDIRKRIGRGMKPSVYEYLLSRGVIIGDDRSLAVDGNNVRGGSICMARTYLEGNLHANAFLCQRSVRSCHRCS